MSNKLMLTFALVGIIVVFSCGLLLPIPIGFKVSMITAGSYDDCYVFNPYSV